MCDWPEGLSRPLSSPVSVVTSSPGPPERGLLWAGGNSSLCVRIGQNNFRGQHNVRCNAMIRKQGENEQSSYIKPMKTSILVQHSTCFVLL